MDRERYNRQLSLKGFGESGQQKLGQASVLVIGAGGLGCPALQYLAAAGIGKIGIADGDLIELSNLQRQVLYQTLDIGRLKAEVASDCLTALNPGIQIQPYAFFVERSNILQIITDYDIVLDGSDNFQTRYLVNDACTMLSKPLISAAVFGFEAQVGIFCVPDANGHTTNYRDLFPVSPDEDQAPNCAENGVLGVLPGIIGSIQAAEAIKLITGIGSPLINKILNYNLLDHSLYVVHIPPTEKGSYSIPASEQEFLLNPDYTAADPGVTEITVTQMLALGIASSVALVDIRQEPYAAPWPEVPFRIIALAELTDKGIVDFPEKHLVICCQYGKRSLATAHLLSRKHGTKKIFYSLKGGFARWHSQLNNLKNE